MAISAKDVNKLREHTGAGMMDCKKALEEAGGDFELAIEILRKKGQKVSASRQDRDAKEGGIFVTSRAGKSWLIELNCETDFVAKNDDFKAIGESIVNTCADGNADTIDALLDLKINNLSVRQVLEENMGKIGEKLEVSKVVTLSAEKVVSYIHQGSKLGVLVALEGTDGVADVEVIGRDIAMQIAAMNPIAIDEKGVDPAIIQKEIEIGKEQARAEGKPENILEKIAMGKLNKFYQEVTLLGQEFFKDPSKNIAQYLKDKGANLKVVAFKRIVLGAKD